MPPVFPLPVPPSFILSHPPNAQNCYAHRHISRRAAAIGLAIFDPERALVCLTRPGIVRPAILNQLLNYLAPLVRALLLGPCPASLIGWVVCCQWLSPVTVILERCAVKAAL